MLWQVAWQSCIAAPTLKLYCATVSVSIRIREVVKWWETISLSRQNFMKKWYLLLESETYNWVFSIWSPFVCEPQPPSPPLFTILFLAFCGIFNSHYCLCLLTIFFLIPLRWISQKKNGLTKIDLMKISNDYFSHEYHCTASCCHGIFCGSWQLISYHSNIALTEWCCHWWQSWHHHN